MPSPLTPPELQILREVANLEPPSPWGAWVGSCLEELCEQGYITSTFGGQLTEKGRNAIAQLEPTPK